MTAEFAEKNEVVCRTIEIRADQTLADLHYAIFYAFDREEEHLYEFQIGGKGPMDPDAQRYVPKTGMGGLSADDGADGSAEEARLECLGLEEGDAFGYWFDFGDDWMHQITVAAIRDRITPGECPRLVGRVGESPPQYPDWDEEDEE